VADEGFEPP